MDMSKISLLYNHVRFTKTDNKPSIISYFRKNAYKLLGHMNRVEYKARAHNNNILNALTLTNRNTGRNQVINVHF